MGDQEQEIARLARLLVHVVSVLQQDWAGNFDRCQLCAEAEAVVREYTEKERR